MIQIDLQKAYDMISWQALNTIMQELDIPQFFLNWIMNSLTIVSYRFSINGNLSKILYAKRGIRQGDPISPYLVAILMGYLHRCIYKMQTGPNFNHHCKCERLKLTNLMFAEDVILFSRGDIMSVELLQTALYKFLYSTSMQVNKTKSKIYFGVVPFMQKIAFCL